MQELREVSKENPRVVATLMARLQSFNATNTSYPKAFIYRVFRFFPRHINSFGF